MPYKYSKWEVVNHGNQWFLKRSAYYDRTGTYLFDSYLTVRDGSRYAVGNQTEASDMAGKLNQ